MKNYEGIAYQLKVDKVLREQEKNVPEKMEGIYNLVRKGIETGAIKEIFPFIHIYPRMNSSPEDYEIIYHKLKTAGIKWEQTFPIINGAILCYLVDQANKKQDNSISHRKALTNLVGTSQIDYLLSSS
jgi:hypothetical protein